MQTGEVSSRTTALDQLSRSIERVNDLNRDILSKNLELGNKMLKVDVQEKVATPPEGFPGALLDMQG